MVKILRVIFGVVFVAFFSNAFSQGFDFYAVADGDWNASGTWSYDGFNPIVCGPCTEGVDFPGASDNAYTNGRIVTVNGFAGGAKCKNLFVDAHTPGGVNFAAPLTITGSLLGWDPLMLMPAGPTVNVFSGTSNITFTGTNWDGGFWVFLNEVISYWNSNTPITRAQFNLPAGTTFTIDNDGVGSVAIAQISIIGSSSLATSFFNFGISPPEAGLEVATSLSLTPGTSFSSDRPLRQTAVETSRIPTVSIAGTLTASSYVNAVNFTVTPTGIFETSYAGPDQTNGWWYQTSAPTGGTLSIGSTVRYNAGGDQNIVARTYGNLELDGTGDRIVANAAGLNIQGTLSILSSSITLNTTAAAGVTIGGSLINDGNWSPQQLVTFSGATPGTVGGSQSTTFNGGITVNKSTGSLTMATATNINTNISNGIAITSGTLNLGNVNTTLTGGNISNSGTLTSGTSGTLIVQGTSEFSGTGVFDLRNLTVQSTGDALFLQDVSFKGNIVNNGSLSFANDIDVTFNGTGTQTISGNSFSIFDMIVDKGSSTLSNNGTVVLLGTLTMLGGTFDADGSGSGNFILNSDSNGDARIGPMSGGSVVGNVTFERFFDNTVTDRYRNFAFPVTGVTVEGLKTFFRIVDGSFAWYQESVPGDYDQGWQIQNSGALVNGRAYTAGMYDVGQIRLSFRGTLLKTLPTTDLSPHNYNITYTDDPTQPADQDGWNFVANPYASPIDWNSAEGWSKIGGIDAVAAVWDAVGGAYRYSGSTWNGVVASGQSFWVHTTSAAQLHSTEDVKVDVANPAFYRMKTIDESNRLMVRLEDDRNYDVAVIQYKEKATPEYDGAYDAFKLPNRIFNLSSLTPDGSNLAVNVLPRSFCTNRLPLNVTNIEPGSYKLTFEGLTSFEGLDSLVLYDKFLERTVRVTDGFVYNFDVTTSAKSWGAGRFELLFSYDDLTPFTAEIAMDGRKLVSNAPTGNQWMLNGEILPDETDNVLIPTAAGEYQVMVSDGICTSKSEVFRLEQLRSRVHPNPATTHFIVDLTDVTNDDLTKSGDVYLYSVTGQLILKEPFTTTGTELSVKLEGIAAGEYIVNLVVGDSKIVAKERLVVK